MTRPSYLSSQDLELTIQGMVMYCFLPGLMVISGTPHPFYANSLLVCHKAQCLVHFYFQYILVRISVRSYTWMALHITAMLMTLNSSCSSNTHVPSRISASSPEATDLLYVPTSKYQNISLENTQNHTIGWSKKMLCGSGQPTISLSSCFYPDLVMQVSPLHHQEEPAFSFQRDHFFPAHCVTALVQSSRRLDSWNSLLTSLPSNSWNESKM